MALAPNRELRGSNSQGLCWLEGLICLSLMHQQYLLDNWFIYDYPGPTEPWSFHYYYKTIRGAEYFHLYLWILKDLSWTLGIYYYAINKVAISSY